MLPFTAYLRQGKVKRQTPDTTLSHNLLLQAKARLAYTSQQDITPRNASFILESAYEAARESAQSLMARAGFKPYSHEATIRFLAEYYEDVFGEDMVLSK